jgi:hypothetical protein
MFFKCLLYGVLFACGLAMLLLLAGFLSWQEEIFWLAAPSYTLALWAILLAYSLLVTGGLGLLVQGIVRDIADYFRKEARALRAVKSLQVLKYHALQRLQMEERQIQYLHELARQRLLADDDKKQSRALCKAIQTELQAALAPSRYKAVYKLLKRYRRQANPAAMLALRKQVLDRCSLTG